MGFLPLVSLVVNGLEIPADMLMAESMFHDIDDGTLTVTFVNVKDVQTNYLHNVGRD